MLQYLFPWSRPELPPATHSEVYEHIVVSGNPFGRGQEHGSKAKDKIRISIAQYKASSSLPPPSVIARYIHDIYLPAILSMFPEGLEEMKGIAQGAEVELDDIILLNARYDLSRVKDGTIPQEFVGECTSIAYIDDSNVFIAQNWDMSQWLYDLNTIIVLESHDSDGSVIISLTEAGQLARSGMNSSGLGLCANSLWSVEDSLPVTDAKLPFTLVRRMFLECRNFAGGIKTLCTFPRHVSGNIMIGSACGLAMDLEITPSKSTPLHPSPSLITHANHFVGPGDDTYPGGSSLFRDRRLFALLRGKVDIQRLKKAFADHAGFPRSLCEHADKGKEKYGAASSNTMTVASVIYDLKKLEMHLCKGNPCCGTWETLSIRKQSVKA